jgi:hypothetical protein
MTVSDSAPRLLRTATLLSLLILPLSACSDDDPTGPNQEEGTLHAVIQDQENGPGSTSPASVVGLSGADGQVEGEFRADLRVQVEVDGSWMDVGQMTDVTAMAELQTGEDRNVASAQIAARSYDRARVVINNAETHVLAGSVIGTGLIDALVTISLGGGGEMVVESTQPVTIQTDGSTELVLELNSRSWLTEDAADIGAVTRGEFESSASLTVR